MRNDPKTECWTCEHKRSVPGNAHIKCAKPDPRMTRRPARNPQRLVSLPTRLRPRVEDPDVRELLLAAGGRMSLLRDFTGAIVVDPSYQLEVWRARRAEELQDAVDTCSDRL